MREKSKQESESEDKYENKSKKKSESTSNGGFESAGCESKTNSITTIRKRESEQEREHGSKQMRGKNKGEK